MIVFSYDKDKTHLQNFIRWCELSDIERREFLLEPYPLQEARLIFHKEYGHLQESNKGGITI
jgi:hypothetical protein